MKEAGYSPLCGHNQYAEVAIAEPLGAYCMLQLSNRYGVDVHVFVNDDATEMARAAQLYGSANYDTERGPDPSKLVAEALEMQLCGAYVVGLAAHTVDACAFDAVTDLQSEARELALRVN